MAPAAPPDDVSNPGRSPLILENRAQIEPRAPLASRCNHIYDVHYYDTHKHEYMELTCLAVVAIPRLTQRRLAWRNGSSHSIARSRPCIAFRWLWRAASFKSARPRLQNPLRVRSSHLL